MVVKNSFFLALVMNMELKVKVLILMKLICVSLGHVTVNQKTM